MKPGYDLLLEERKQQETHSQGEAENEAMTRLGGEDPSLRKTSKSPTLFTCGISPSRYMEQRLEALHNQRIRNAVRAIQRG